MEVIQNLTKQISNEDMKYIYIYRLIKDKMNFYVEEDKQDIETYGIEIEKQDLQEGRIIKIDRECVKNISPEKVKIQKLMEFLCDHEVSPIHLIDIIGEYVDNCVSDFDKKIKVSCSC